MRWDEGWIGYGNRIHRADFLALARIGPPLDRSRELRSRRRADRVLIRYEFEFSQDGKRAYYGNQTAQFSRETTDR